jgi:hypothetical protein
MTQNNKEAEVQAKPGNNNSNNNNNNNNNNSSPGQ